MKESNGSDVVGVRGDGGLGGGGGRCDGSGDAGGDGKSAAWRALRAPGPIPDAEVEARAKRRHFSAAYKARVVEEAHGGRALATRA